MTKKPSAIDELVDFGYEVQDDGSYVRFKNKRPVNKWEKVAEGWLHFRRVAEAWEAVDYTLLPKWQGVAGLHPSTHPECYEYVFPEDWVLQEYTQGNEARRAQAAEQAARKAQG